MPTAFPFLLIVSFLIFKFSPFTFLTSFSFLLQLFSPCLCPFTPPSLTLLLLTLSSCWPFRTCPDFVSHPLPFYCHIISPSCLSSSLFHFILPPPLPSHPVIFFPLTSSLFFLLLLPLSFPWSLLLSTVLLFLLSPPLPFFLSLTLFSHTTSSFLLSPMPLIPSSFVQYVLPSFSASSFCFLFTRKRKQLYFNEKDTLNNISL